MGWALTKSQDKKTARGQGHQERDRHAVGLNREHLSSGSHWMTSTKGTSRYREGISFPDKARMRSVLGVRDELSNAELREQEARERVRRVVSFAGVI